MHSQFVEACRLNAPTVDSLFGLNPTTPSRPGTGIKLTNSSSTAMPHQEFTDLTKEETSVASSSG
jgi:hypothetical protein